MELFSNTTWTSGPLTPEKEKVLSHWTSEHTNVFVTLVLFIVVQVCRPSFNNVLVLLLLIFSC